MDSGGFKVYGVLLGIVGLLLLIVGSLTIVGAVTALPWETDLLFLASLAVLIAGLGIFGYGWTAKAWPVQHLSVNAKWSVIITIVTTLAIAVAALWANAADNVIWTMVSAGALGSPAESEGIVVVVPGGGLNG